MVKKIVKLSLAVLFALFAVVQINDPDPFLWVVIYGLTSIISAYSAFKKIPSKVVLVVLIVFIGYALILSPSFFSWISGPDKEELFGEMIYDKPHIEGTREFLGLLIASSALFYIFKKP